MWWYKVQERLDVVASVDESECMCPCPSRGAVTLCHSKSEAYAEEEEVLEGGRRRGSSAPRSDVADTAAAGSEEDEVLGKHGGAVATPAAPPADGLPSTDDATFKVLRAGHAVRRTRASMERTRVSRRGTHRGCS